MITADEVRRLFIYDPLTGIFRKRKTNKIIGCPSDRGYLRINRGYKQYYLHRLAFLWMEGKIPEFVDHINGIVNDNRWENLREATLTQNQGNSRMRKDNTSGYKGIHFHKKSGLYRSHIAYQGKQYHLGVFKTAQEAHQAYCDAAQKFFGEFNNSGLSQH